MSRRLSTTLTGTACVLMLALEPGTVCAQQEATPPIYSLVVGVSEYLTLQTLPGALRDAQLLGSTLRQIGAKEVVVLTNQQATRPMIRQAWYSLKTKAGSTGILLFAYAGHGDRLTEAVAGDEEDHKDEVLLLSQFDAKNPDMDRDVIRDNEWRTWIADAAPNRVITLYDSCHSGSMTRSSVGAARRGARRDGGGGLDSIPTPKMLSGQYSKAFKPEQALLPNEIYIGATQDALGVEEWDTPDGMHGALSYSFARALAGAADRNGDRSISGSELRTFIQDSVSQITGELQRPEVRLSGDGQERLFAAPAHVTVRPPTPVKFALIGASADGAARFRAGLADLTEIMPPSAATLAWNVSTGEISTGTDIVAQHIASVEGARGVIAKWKVLENLKSLAERGAVDLTLAQGSRRYRRGESVTFSVPAKAAGQYLTAFNLATDGELQYIYPSPKCPQEANRLPALSGRFSLPSCGERLVVSKPFGADHLIVVLTREEPQALRAALKKWSGSKVPADLPIAQLLVDQSSQIGIAGLYSEDGS